MRDKLDTSDIHARKAYLRAVISRIEVGDEKSALSEKRPA
jgi:hypothetical protein